MLIIFSSKDQVMATAGKLSGQWILESIRDGTASILKIPVSRPSDLSVKKKTHAELVRLKSKELRCLILRMAKLAVPLS